MPSLILLLRWRKTAQTSLVLNEMLSFTLHVISDIFTVTNTFNQPWLKERYFLHTLLVFILFGISSCELIGVQLTF